MNTFHRFFSKALASLMLAGLCFGFVSSVSAQCPSDIAPTGISWHGPNTTYMSIPPGSINCEITVKYCYRTVGGVQQYYIEELDSVGCDTTSWASILAGVRDEVFQFISAGNCATDPCSGILSTYGDIFMSQCAKIVKNGSAISCIFCPNGAYCEKTCQLCLQGPPTNANVLCNCTITTIGTADCSPEPDGWPNQSVVDSRSWGSGIYGTCYLSNCDSY